MMKASLLAFLACTLIGCSTAPKENTSYRSGNPGSASLPISACVPIKEISTEETPPALFSRVDSCISGNDYQRAAELYFTAVIFASFDTRRIVENEAKGALGALLMAFAARHPQQTQDRFFSTAERIAAENADLCKELRSLGHPTYEPTYMINYVRMALHRNDSGTMVENFDPEVSWSAYLTDKFGCH